MDNNIDYKKQVSTFLPYIIAWIFVLLVNFLCVGGKENIASIVSILYLLFVFTQPPENFLLYVIIAIASTRSMELFGASVSVWICLEYLIKRMIKTGLKVHAELFVPLVLYLLYDIQFFIRFDSIMYGFLQPMKTVIVLWFLYSYADEMDSIFFSNNKLKLALVVWLIGIVMAIIPSLLTTSIIGRISAYKNDPNLLAVQAVFLLACASVLYMNKKGDVSYGLYLIIVSISLIICLVCGSRTGFLLLGVVVVSTTLLNLFSHRLGKIIIIAISVAIIVVIAMSTSRVQLYLSNISRRLDLLEQSGNLSNGRFQLWEEYINTFNSDQILWLIGLGTYTNYGLPQMAHNMFLEDVAQYGIIGIIILFFAYICVLRKTFKTIKVENRKLRLYGLIPFLLPLIGGMTLHSMTNLPNTVMLYVGISVYAISC